MNQRKKQKIGGFTLIELLIIIAVIAILATIVFVALDPLARFQDARNARRWTDVNAILNAIKLYQVDNKGVLPGDIDNATVNLAYEIGNGTSCSVTCSMPVLTTENDCVDLNYLVGRGYLPAIPHDPNAPNSSDEFTHYYVIKSETGALTIGACDEELGTNSQVPTISVSR
jgi:prepilin-type N-terminal cleavage/methylation domain-containing protein